MILFGAIVIFLLSLLLVLLTAIGILGVGFLMVFGDFIACIAIIVAIVKFVNWIRN